MKKTLSALIFCVFLLNTNAQVAINSYFNGPDASAILDVSSSNKGLLIPRVHISSVNPTLVIPNAAHGLIVFNTNTAFSKGEGLYYNSGQPNAIEWKPVSDLIFPYYKGTTDNGSLFRLDNYSQNTASTTVRALSGGGTAVYAETNNGYALQTKGKINIAGGSQTPAQGKVLTSDANGNATWEGAIAFFANGIQEGGAGEIPPFTSKKVPYLTERYDLGNNFNPSSISPHSTFTVPVHGIYHFDAAVCFDVNLDDTKTYIELVRVRDGVENALFISYQVKESSWINNTLSMDCELLPGDQVYIKAGHSNGSAEYLATLAAMNFFSGRLVIRLN